MDRKREVGGQRLGSGNDPAVDREGGKGEKGPWGLGPCSKYVCNHVSEVPRAH